MTKIVKGMERGTDSPRYPFWTLRVVIIELQLSIHSIALDCFSESGIAGYLRSNVSLAFHL